MKMGNKFTTGPLIPTHWCNKVLDFYSTDSEERYINNARDFKLKGEHWEYFNKPITYTFNSQGYRTREWADIDWNDAVAIFGCSCVVGEGLTEEDTISAQLSRMINRPVVNLGASGTGMLFSFYNSIMLDKYLPTPHAVIQLWSDSSRIERYSNNDIIIHTPTMLNKNTSSNGIMRDEFYKSWAYYPENINTHAWLIAQASRAFWHPKTKYYELSLFVETSNLVGCTGITKVDYGRDLGHTGVNTAKIIAEDIAANIS